MNLDFLRERISFDPNISFKAMGIYTLMLEIYTKKERINTSDFKNVKDCEGTTSIKTAIQELLDNHYITRLIKRENGKIAEYEYFIVDENEEVRVADEDLEIGGVGNFNDLIKKMPDNFNEYQNLWTQSVGTLGAVMGGWLINISNKMEYEVFAEAIFEAQAKDIRRADYIKKILDSWVADGITNMEQLNEARKARNNKFEEASLKRAEKSPIRSSNTPNTTKHINKASKIKPKQEIIDLFADKDNTKEDMVDGQHGQNFEKTTDITAELERIRARRRSNMRPL